MRTRQSARALGLVASLLAAAPAVAAIDNAFANPGFEDGTLNPYSTTFTSALTDPSQAHSGNALAVGDVIPVVYTQSVVQNFAPIDTALITESSFWYRQPDPNSGTPVGYATWGEGSYSGGPVSPVYAPFTVIPDGQWHKVSFGSPGTGAYYTSFGALAQNLTGAPIPGLQFDDFLVTTSPLPEPTAAAAAGAGAGAVGLTSLAARRRRPQ